MEQTLAQIGAARILSKLDANSGFWQVELSRDSALLTTFITPFGRYCFNRLPFGITSAPEHFQRRMGDIVSGLEGVVCLVGDILVFGETQEEHDRCLTAVLARLKDAGLTLNSCVVLRAIEPSVSESIAHCSPAAATTTKPHQRCLSESQEQPEPCATTATARGGNPPKGTKLQQQQQQQTKDVYAQPDKFKKKTKNGPDASTPMELYAQPDKSKKQKKEQPKT